MVAATQPYFSPWNYELLQWFFHIWPHSNVHTAIAYHLIRNPLISTWIYAVVFYFFWWKKDDDTEKRRYQLVASIVAVILAVAFSGVTRVWFTWPAPAVSPQFQGLYPESLWGRGSTNCFPSHSTLVYLTVVLGFFPLSRMTGALLVPYTFLAVSLPRIYVGGHYPIDVAGSAVLSLGAILFVQLSLMNSRVREALVWLSTRGKMTELLLLLWLCELGEGFRAADTSAHMAVRIARHMGWIHR